MKCEKTRRRQQHRTFNCLNCGAERTRRLNEGVGKLKTPRESFRFCSRRCCRLWHGKRSVVDRAARNAAYRTTRAEWEQAYRIVRDEEREEARLHRLSLPRKKPEKLCSVECVRCGKEFKAVRKNAVFCSKTCRKALRRHLGYLYKGIVDAETRRLFQKITGSIHRVHSDIDKVKKEIVSHDRQ
jgi:hypothetical protein